MTHLQNLSDESLLHRTSELAKQEIKLTLEVIHHLREIYRRKLFADLGYGNLHEYCVKHLGYDPASAQRRIDSKSFTLEEKKEIVEKLEGKSTREVERELMSLSSNPEVHLKEKTKQVTVSQVEMSFFADPELQELLEKIKGVLSHQLKDGSTTELIKHIANDVWERINPAREPKRTTPITRLRQQSTAREWKADRREHIPAEVSRLVWKRSEGSCEAISKITGKRCNSRHKVQLDHYPIPYAMGGPSTKENLRLACRECNLRFAIQKYGLKKMEQHLKRERTPLRH